MTAKFIYFIAKLFDSFHHYWESKKNHQRVAGMLVVVFIAAIIFTLLDHFNWLPSSIIETKILSKYFAIEMAFTLLLIVEVIGLIFALARSVSTSLVKQLEIFSLILLRSSFKQFGHLENGLQWQETFEPIAAMLSDAFGALVIFALIIVISKIQKHAPITKDPVDQTRFILFKKNTAVLLFVVFTISGILDIILYLLHGDVFDFFTNFYTILIFNDILLVLISLRYNYSFLVVFRNSAFAVATLIIRMALTSPPFYNAILGSAASLFALGTVYFYNKYVEFSMTDKN
ncbi:MAG: hypothetical protein JW729_06385 [Bacteroidales bacterium]|nr:hypothetical protein [Bacteroidales bacterium]